MTKEEMIQAIETKVGPITISRHGKNQRQRYWRAAANEWRWLIIFKGAMAWTSAEQIGTTEEAAVKHLYELLHDPDHQLINTESRPPQCVIDARAAVGVKTAPR